MVEAKDLQVTGKYTFDVMDYTEAVDVKIDWSSLAFDETYSSFKIKSAVNENVGTYSNIGELDKFVLSPGSYIIEFSKFNEENLEEIVVHEEQLDITTDTKVTFSGTLLDEIVDVTATTELAEYSFIPFPGLPSGVWQSYTLKQTNLFERKPWIITFNEPVNADTIEGNVYIVDNRGVPIDVSFAYSDSFKALQIIPQQQYHKGTYYIYIDGSVESLTGKKLGKGIKGEFTF